MNGLSAIFRITKTAAIVLTIKTIKRIAALFKISKRETILVKKVV